MKHVDCCLKEKLSAINTVFQQVLLVLFVLVGIWKLDGFLQKNPGKRSILQMFSSKFTYF